VDSLTTITPPIRVQRSATIVSLVLCERFRGCAGLPAIGRSSELVRNAG
jgi:hypothetical protein